MKFNSVGQTQTVEQQTGEANEVNIVVKCFIRFPIPHLQVSLKVLFRDRESVKAFQNNVYLVYLTSLKVHSLCLSHTGILSDGED